MIKFLPVVIFVFLLIGTIFYLRSRMVEPAKTPADYKAVTVQAIPDNATTAEKIKILEQSIQLLATEIGKINSGLSSSTGSNASSALIETRIKNLETSVNSLKADMTSLKTIISPTTSTTPTSAKKSPAYIPLGSGGNSTDRNYYSVGGYQISIDPADYVGYTSMQLEATLNLNETVGTVNARLYNITDNSAVGSSNASTNSATPTLVSSSGFTLASGRKTYVLQIQSTQGYQANVLSARIKINF